MSEIFSSKKRTELRSEYCISNGYSYFNDMILNDYTDYLELRLMEAINKANGVNPSDSGLRLHNVMLSCPKCNGKNIMQRSDGVIGCVDCFHSWRHEA